MLEVNNLHFSQNGKNVLRGVSFEIRLNQIIGISGETSSGKSLIFETILNFIQFSNGTIIFENKKVAYNNKNHIKSLKNSIGYISQNDYFLDNGILLDNLKMIGKTSKDKAIEIASITGIADSLYLNVNNVSDSDKIRFKLALALLKEPYLIFIDEPLSSLLFEEIKLFLEVVNQIAKERRIGILIASQNKNIFTESIFDKVLELKDGILNDSILSVENIKSSEENNIQEENIENEIEITEKHSEV